MEQSKLACINESGGNDDAPDLSSIRGEGSCFVVGFFCPVDSGPSVNVLFMHLCASSLLVFYKPAWTWLDMDAGERRGEMEVQQAGEERIDVSR